MTRAATCAARSTQPRGQSSGSPKLALAVQYATSDVTLPNRARVRQWVRAAQELDARVTVRFVGAAEGRAINFRFRGKDHATNVLTFVYDDGSPCAGDIVLCAPIIRQEAAVQGKLLAAHYTHLVVHGMLHLQGYDHERDADAAPMEARETMILARLGLPDPYSVATT